MSLSWVLSVEDIEASETLISVSEENSLSEL